MLARTTSVCNSDGAQIIRKTPRIEEGCWPSSTKNTKVDFSWSVDALLGYVLVCTTHLFTLFYNAFVSRRDEKSYFTFYFSCGKGILIVPSWLTIILLPSLWNEGYRYLSFWIYFWMHSYNSRDKGRSRDFLFCVQLRFVTKQHSRTCTQALNVLVQNHHGTDVRDMY